MRAACLVSSRRFCRPAIPRRTFLATGSSLPKSNVEQLGIMRLDRIALFFHRRRVVFHGLDILEWLASRLLPGVRMHRAQAADVDDELLCVTAEAERLEQLCGVR